MACVLKYRTKDDRATYKFSFENVGGFFFPNWRAYILSQPDYGGRDDSGHATHRYSSGGRVFVCWTKRLTSLSQAKQVAALWADATQEYIRSGKRF